MWAVFQPRRLEQQAQIVQRFIILVLPLQQRNPSLHHNSTQHAQLAGAPLLLQPLLTLLLLLLLLH